MERGITRFITLYYGEDAEKAGPIRSGRFFDEHVFTMYQSIFVFGNADKRVMDHFVELGRSVVNRFVLEQPVDTKRSCRADGFAYPATWRRPEEEGVLGLLSPSGKPLAFRPGVTFFQVVGQSTAFRQSEGAWEFEFAIP